MSPQIAFQRRRKVTLAALTRLFRTVCFRMYSHRACIKGCKVTLVAFVCLFSIHCAFSNVSSNRLPVRMHSHIGYIFLLFSTVRFKMCPQIACLRRVKVTLVAFVRLFSTVCFQMSSQITFLIGCIFTLAAFI